MSELTTSDAAGPGVGTLLRFAASGGRSDRLRIALTGAGAAAATVTLLLGAAVAFIGPANGPYELDVLDQPGLRPGVLVALLMLCVPILVFVGLCTRVGAPARDRRLAMFRMAGATPRETTRIAAYETGVAASLGSLAGVAIFFIGRVILDGTRPGEYQVVNGDGSTMRADGLVRLLPTDVWVPLPVVAAVVLAITIGSVVMSSIALRAVRISPFGVSRTTPSDPPTRTAAALFVLGVAGLTVLGFVARNAEGGMLPVALAAFALLVLSTAGLMAGSASISVAVGRFIAPRTSRPDLLIAARRMVAAPYTSSRATASVVLAVLFGAAVQATRSAFLTSQMSEGEVDAFYLDTFRLLDGVLIVAISLATANLLVTSAEAIVERRRNLAVLRAGGTPRSVLARSVLMETVVPLVPSVLLAATAGVFAARSFFGTSAEQFVIDANGNGVMVTVGVPVPWERLALLCGGAIVASLLVTAVSLLFLGRSTRPAELRAAA